ncbi:hypothetical protein [Bosea sp. BIWAKO-01]|uniref:hypothetical protein n=1 Tax=Bosea sp. BIWAKO-01 TaxID=506668 RepID=UPI00114CBBAA|nr:hypothetical protein [Bosea sp. BIWAKO-01]
MSLHPSDAASAGNLISTSTMAGLLRCLVQKGVLEPDDIREIYETALLLLEQQQGSLAVKREVFVAARTVLENGLQPRG